MKYNPNEIEAKWQKYWSENQTFRAEDNSDKPKYYVLDMFPYPSGAGLHVGHPLGYIASDIVARYKRHQGFNVLHPMGYDSFGLPAEQYAIQTGQHPEKTTKANIARYREQLDKIGFSFDWEREVRTSDPSYYRWTQWIFIQLFDAWYNKKTDKAESITTLISVFEKEGNASVDAVCDDDVFVFSSEEWKSFSSEEKQRILLKYRMTYLAETEVNWCPALGTVLANDEIVNGVSERGGHPVIRKKMTQWSMRISAYADRLLQGLESIDWTESLKESQRNWIGKSVGASIDFEVVGGGRNLSPNPSPQEGGVSHSNVIDEDSKNKPHYVMEKNLSNSPQERGVSYSNVIDENSKNKPHYVMEKNLSLNSPQEKGVSHSNVTDENSKYVMEKNLSNSPQERGVSHSNVTDENLNEKPYITTNPENYKRLHESAKEMRKVSTEAENALWQLLRRKNLGYKFRRQHIVDKFITDFICLPFKLIIEVDGGYHEDIIQKEYDEERTIILNELGYKVMRFTNDDVLKNSTFVINQIKEELTQQEKSGLAPLSCGEGLGERLHITVFTTRPDTIYGVTYMTLAPEHELVMQITTDEQKQAVSDYIEATAKRSERERMADTKTISGVFTGAYARHPLTGAEIPIWIGDYVLAGYGTGAVMAVPAGDERDYAFANHFKGQHGMPEIINIFDQNISENAYKEKGGFKLQNSGELNGLDYKEATATILQILETEGVGKSTVNYRLRDAVFSRQRYWGEPFPVYYVDGLPQMIDSKFLPIILPEVEKYLPTEDGQPPLGNATHWAWDTAKNEVVPNQHIDHKTVFPLELNTMPGWAGSSWYWLRYMDAHNAEQFVGEKALDYWQNVDLYIGGSEHATGHLLYARFWNKFLKDIGIVPTEEPFKKLINQGMILGTSAFVYRTEDSQKLISKNKINDTKVQAIHADLSVINDVTNELDIEKFRNHPLYQDYKNAQWVLEDNGSYIVGREVEKMSKSKYNVVNPDDICEQYGADTLRLYEMFLGPLEQAKPWNTAGISGVSGFLKKLWRLYFDDNGLAVTDAQPSKEALKSLHKTIKKVSEDIENFSFNTSVSQFMICVNELTQLKCRERAVLEPLAIVIAPYAPHIAEELWSQLGHNQSVAHEKSPTLEEKYLVESSKEYPVSFNGKVRFKIELPLDMSPEEVEKTILADERTQAQLEGRNPKKIIVVPGRIINIVE